MRNSESFMRMRTLQVIVLLIFALIVGRLAYIQLFDSRYDDLARANVLRHVVQYLLIFALIVGRLALSLIHI